MSGTKTTVGNYLMQRLLQLGVEHIFALPGDFNLDIAHNIDVESDVEWVGCGNELNASYAADAYARERGFGAMVTTYGVGELSAVNGIAGAFAEFVPVLHIVGTPGEFHLKEFKGWHHTLTDNGDYNTFFDIFEKVTVANELLLHSDIDAIPGQIDRVILEMLKESRPGYLGFPYDLVNVEIDASNLAKPLKAQQAPANVLEKFEAALKAELAGTDQLFALAGALIHRRGLTEQFEALANSGAVEIATQFNSLDLLPAGHPANLGTYLGFASSPDPKLAQIETARPLILIGAMDYEITFAYFSETLLRDEAIELKMNSARVGSQVFEGVTLEQSLPVLTRVVTELKNPTPISFEPPAPLGSGQPLAQVLSASASDDKFTQDSFWAVISGWFKTLSDVDVVSDLGTSLYGTVQSGIPAGAHFLSQTAWASIGYALPAVLGVGLAERAKRPLLFIGDGAAQLSIQELGTISERGVNPIIFLSNNKGYSIERMIKSDAPLEAYHDIRQWDWKLLAQGFMPGKVETHTVSTPNELIAALEGTKDESKAHFVEVKLEKEDYPWFMKHFTGKIAEFYSAE